MTFARPELLPLCLLPVLLAVLFILAARRSDRDLTRFAARGLLPRLYPEQTVRHERRWRIGLSVFALACLTVAAAGPQWGRQWQESGLEGASIIFALDTSRSMLAADLAPDRLERAKSAISELVSGLHGDRVGLVLFAGSSFLQVPPTPDYAAFAAALDSANTDLIPRGGTDIAGAIDTAVSAFQNDSSASKVLFLITDGENHEGDPEQQAEKAAQAGIIVCSVGVGSPSGELIPITDENGNTTYLKDNQGQLVKSSLNEDLLRSLAKSGGGGYVRATNISFGLDDLYDRTVAGLAKTGYVSKWQEQRVDHYQIPLFLAIMALAAEMFVGRRGGVKIAGHEESQA